MIFLVFRKQQFEKQTSCAASAPPSAGFPDASQNTSFFHLFLKVPINECRRKREMITETLTGQLSIDNPDGRKAFLIDKINKVINPPRPATETNVNIRAMYLLNDLVNSHGGRFDREELSALCELILDTPVMIGHNRAEAPLARTFHAELEEKDEVLWLKSYFYWPRRDEGAADEMLEKIDSGILKECSISFVYTLPECSVCGEDMRKCPHQIDLSSDEERKQYFYYKGVKEVLETSLVYKGSVKGTFVTDKLALANNAQITVTGCAVFSGAGLRQSPRYIV
jgi:hypothetical protein